MSLAVPHDERSRDIPNKRPRYGKSRYENLSNILSVAAMLVIIGFIGQLTKGVILQATMNEAKADKPAVQGYTRPPVQGYKRPPEQGYKRPPKVLNSFKPNKSKELTTPQLPIAGLTDQQNAKVIKRFQEAVVLLHAKKYKYAMSALDEVTRIVPEMPEAYVNMGYALLGLKRYDEAAGAFNKAIELRPYQANAYYGLASVMDVKKDYEGALGAMRTFIHLSKADADPLFIAKARSAIWEWQGLLGRIPNVKAAPPGSKPQIDEYIGGNHAPVPSAATSAKPAVSQK